MAGTYTYEPAMITSYGKDRMRFELGDVMVDGKERTCALSDEEYIVLCDDVQSAKDWKRAKLKCLESIFRRFSLNLIQQLALPHSNLVIGLNCGRKNMRS